MLRRTNSGINNFRVQLIGDHRFPIDNQSNDCQLPYGNVLGITAAMFSPRLALAIVAAAVATAPASAQSNWPQFRGPNAGVADDNPALPDRWSQTENVVW